MLIYLLRSVGALKNMLHEMEHKQLDLHRLTKTAGILMSVGVSANSIPVTIVRRCIREQNPDGGWVGITDTMWNAFFLSQYDFGNYQDQVLRALEFLQASRSSSGLWGRSPRDRSRIPVSGMIIFLFPNLVTDKELYLLERLWLEEKNSLTYKAGYVLMSMGRCSYSPRHQGLIEETVDWLVTNQREDGSFAPWKNHPVASDVVCTSIAVLGLLYHSHLVPSQVFERAGRWLRENQLCSGIWPYHEIEHGASWGLWALSRLSSYFEGNSQ